MRGWDDFGRFEPVINGFMPDMGEGETKASQVCTAVNKLVYKWFNDGDVFDNTGAMNGWCNDLSSYANWLYKHIEASREILDGVYDCADDDDYTELLWELCETCLDLEDLENLDKVEKVGSIYTEDGEFKFAENNDDDEEEWW